MPNKRELAIFKKNKNRRWHATDHQRKKPGPTHRVQAHGVTVASHDSTRILEKRPNEDSGRLAMSPATLCWARVKILYRINHMMFALFY
jgi:hypothetical protein